MSEWTLVTPDANFCVYFHRLPNTNEVIFIGHGPLVKAFDMSEARRNNKWLEMTANAPGIEVSIIATFHGLLEARKFAVQLIQQYKPPCHQGAHRITRDMVVRVYDGKIYAKMVEAAEDNGISPGAMSNHLNRRAGYDSVRGLQFMRYAEWVAKHGNGGN
jgi:hypothetical protein